MVSARTTSVVLGLAFFAGACAGTGGGGRRVTTRSQTRSVSVPIVLGEPTRAHSGPRLSLRNADYLRLVAPDRLLSEIIEPSDPRHPILRRRVRRDDPITLEQLEDAEVERPADAVILVTTDGPCRAELGAPELTADGYDALGRIWVKWQLTGCGEPVAAPMAVVGDTLPAPLSWTPAVRTHEVTLPPAVPWEHPLEAVAIHAQWGGRGIPTARVIEVREIPDSNPPAVQIYDALIRQEGEQHQPCVDQDTWMQTNGWYHGSWLDPLEPGDDPSATPYLVGALTHDDIVDALVYLDREQPVIVVPEVTTGPDDDETLPSATRYAGPDDPLALQRDWGWSPFSGEPEFAPDCEADEDATTQLSPVAAPQDAAEEP